MAHLTRAPASASAYETAEWLVRSAPIAGRILLSILFLFAGAMKFINWDATANYMAAKGMAFIPILLPAAAILELAGGLSLLLGFKARLGAAALFLFLIPTTLIFHNFWAYEGAEMQNQMQHFLKNLAIMGSLLLVVGFGSGAGSVDSSSRSYFPGTTGHRE